LHSDELHEFFSSPYIIHEIKSRPMRWTGQMAQRVRREIHAGNLKGKDFCKMEA
jgi:hypothetical protein